MFRSAILSAALLMTGLAGAAQAQELQVINQGEQFEVHYPAGYTGNIVGGGAVRVAGQGESQQIAHIDSRFVERSAGIPVFVGGSEGNVAYLSMDQAQQVLAYR
ncbi:hypothetical protein EBE87_02575 [Pseudoroseomonas wenyumeiae]|uniref:Uncharacterized protein n=1 Tax=Teichococcus wenyumeiae TaxID=2478470 RepID=A0A3A9J3Q4_9PROT|nr:hypothetical protein [Pseudoroseomonas wenyumeiae]RKK01827.1 hypothetical protein D6Z83_22950 [Pseudoroseomonas wenyumeiae]RMI27270.1 hypothetical protein EBE87_02575 [Pseudoroseomonas wenyumeiae]